MQAQVGLFNNCNGSCDFCLIKNVNFLTMDEIYAEIERCKENIKYISTQPDNWTNAYRDGISILGGEVFYLQDEKYKKLFLELIDVAIDEVLLKSGNPKVKFSSVSNGNYDPNWLLFPTIDRVVERAGLEHVDMSFSYDLMYRFKSAEHEKRVRDTINAFHDRYNYEVGIQMILTQHVIDLMLNEGWRPSKFIDEYFPGNHLAFLYPHPIERGNHHTGAMNLPGFNFKRKDFLKAMHILKTEEPFVYQAFDASTHNSAVFKPTMLFAKGEKGDEKQMPILCGGKEIINPNCFHSTLYQCYIDSDRCMLCDLEGIE